MTQETRELLARTGHLFTQEPDDVGYISDFWRSKIVEMCDLLDRAPLDIADRLRKERRRHAQTQKSLAKSEEAVSSLKSDLERKPAEIERALEQSRAAVRLVEEAVPRMRTLNNAMSPDWLARAAAFLEA